MGCGLMRPSQVEVANPEPSPVNSPPKSPPKGQRRRFSLEKTIAAVEDIRKVYKFDPKVIGHGHFGSVRVGTQKTNPTMRYAIKTIQKEKIKGDLHWLTREVEILKCLAHPNIIRFYETYQDEKFFHIVMEYCTGGELLEWIVESGRLDEDEAANVMRKIFSAVGYLHEHGICHRDLKLENFLFADRSKNAEIKIIDFGLSNKFGETEEKYLSTKVGTPLYVAPEVLKGKYTEACDIWSLGVVLFMLLSGKFPFFGENNDKIFKQILAGRYHFEDRVWKNISSEAKDLISKLLKVDPNARLTAADALKHPWFSKKSNSEIPRSVQPIDSSVIDNLKRYTKAGKFKREALKIVVRMMRDQEIAEMNEAFRALDKEGTGIIKISDVNKAMQGLGLSRTESELNKIISEIAVDSDEFNYIEFISASMNQKKSLTKGKLWNVFKHFAIDEHNYITKNNLNKAMERSGRKIPDEDLEAMIQEIDKNNEGKISYEQFCHMMMSGKIEEDVDKSIDVISDISSPRRRGSLFDEPNQNFQMTAINLQKLTQMADAIQAVKDEEEDDDSDKASKISKAASVKNVVA